MDKQDIIYMVVFLIMLFWVLVSVFFNKDGDQTKTKDKKEKDYNVWSVIYGILIAVPVLAYELFREIFLPRRRY